MLDYTKREKKFMAVTLYDGRKILVRPPKKKLYEKLIEYRNKENKNYDDLLALSASILSENLSGYVFKPEEIEEMFDIDDMKALMTEFSAFTNGITKNPN